MTVGTGIVAGLLLLIVSAIIWRLVKDKKAGKRGCCGDCTHCHGSCRH